MIPALLAMAAVWLVAGWWSHSDSGRSSRRAARLWAAAALTALGAANAAEFMQSPGPWWPLIVGGWSAADGFAALLWIAALVLIFRAREPGRRWGLAMLGGGVAVFAFGLVAAAIGHSGHSGRLCLGETGPFGSWTATLRQIGPVADRDYTGVGTLLSLRFADGVAVVTRPEHRDYIAGVIADGGSRHAGTGLVQRWNGELLVAVNSLRGNPECAELKLEWRSFAHWLRYGAWLSLVGAVMLLAAACRSAWRRAEALERIAMRREDRGCGAMPADRDRLAWQPLAVALAIGLAGLAWQLGQRPAHDMSARPAIDGPAMITVRQSLFGGPRLDNRWIVTADALARHGQFGDAAAMLLGATEQQPDNAEAWLAMGDALYAHAGGRLVPAAALAYQRADRAAARHGGPSTLAAEALSRSGRAEQAQQWLSGSLAPRQPKAP